MFLKARGSMLCRLRFHSGTFCPSIINLNMSNKLFLFTFIIRWIAKGFRYFRVSFIST